MLTKESVLQRSVVIEKPQNGLAGLKYWRNDILAGLMVSLVSLPFSLGIAISSGAPPIAGLISAIIAGMVYPLLGGAYLTISGPAAGLAPVLFVAMTALGKGDREVGYPLVLGVIFLSGCLQIVLNRMKVGRFSAWFSPTVVEGMLASIGLLIIAKELPDLIGRKFESHEFFEIIAEAPAQLLQANPQILLVGGLCLGLMVLLSVSPTRWTKIIPPPLTVVLVGLVLGRVFHIDGKEYLIAIPEKLTDALKLPDFRGLFADHTLWWTAFTTVITLTLIDSVESLATIAGIDKLDPYKRKSSPDRTLLAMGVAKICSSMAGGLTIIPGGVKSTTCIVAGGKTLWANFYNAMFLILYLFLGKALINLIPLSALAAIVVFIGYKLCRPKVWRHVAHIGSEQLLVFSTTVVVTVSTDLLIGIISGMALELLLNLSLAWPARKVAPAANAPDTIGNPAARAFSRFADLFRNPVTHRQFVNGQYHLYFSRPLVSFNSLHVNRELARVPEEAKAVIFHVTDQVTLIDHTSSANLTNFAHDYERSGKGQIQFTGLEEMLMCSEHETCVRLGELALVGAAKGGLSALVAKGIMLFGGSQPGLKRPANPKAAAAAQRRSASDDMRWLSLSSNGAANGAPVRDVMDLGPVPDHAYGHDRDDLARMSLSPAETSSDHVAIDNRNGRRQQVPDGFQNIRHGHGAIVFLEVILATALVVEIFATVYQPFGWSSVLQFFLCTLLGGLLWFVDRKLDGVMKSRSAPPTAKVVPREELPREDVVPGAVKTKELQPAAVGVTRSGD